MAKKHGETFLTRPRYVTKDVHKAENSKFMWGARLTPDGKEYTLSILGIINGFLSYIGLCLYCDMGPNDTIRRYFLGRKRW